MSNTFSLSKVYFEKLRSNPFLFSDRALKKEYKDIGIIFPINLIGEENQYHKKN